MNYKKAWFTLKEAFRTVKQELKSEIICTEDMADIVIMVMDHMEKNQSEEDNSGL